MKVYLVTEKDWKALIARLELEKLQMNERGLYEQSLVTEVHRRFNYEVHCWKEEIERRRAPIS